MRRYTAFIGALALVVAACGGGETAPETTTAPPATEAPAAGDGAEGPVELTVVGERVAFDVTELRVPAGVPVTITFVNKDQGIPHNLRISGPSGPIATEVAPGPVTQTLSFTIDEPGTYDFICAVHPTQMVGTLIVEG